MSISTYLSIITLKVNGLNYSIRKYRMDECIKVKTKHDLSICCLQKTEFICKDTHRLELKGWKKIFHANGSQKKAGVAILTSGIKVDFKIKPLIRDKDVT